MNPFKSKKSFIYIFVLTFLLFFGTTTYAAPKIQSPTKSFYVNDFSDILSSETKEFVMSTNERLSSTEKIPQIVVTTVKSLDGYTIEEYASKMFEKYKIGNSKYDNGVLILLATEDRKIRIEVGYGLESALTDAKTGKILDSSLDLLKENKFDVAISKIFNDIAYEVCTEYGYDVSTFTTPDIQPTSSPDWEIIFIILFFLGLYKTYQIIDFIKNPRERTFWYFFWNEFINLGDSNSSFSSKNYGGGGRSGGGGSSRSF